MPDIIEHPVAVNFENKNVDLSTKIDCDILFYTGNENAIVHLGIKEDETLGYNTHTRSNSLYPKAIPFENKEGWPNIYTKQKKLPAAASFSVLWRGKLIKRNKYYPIITLTFTDALPSAISTGIVFPDISTPSTVTDLTPFCTPSGFKTVILYLQPLKSLQTSKPSSFEGIQGSIVSPS